MNKRGESAQEIIKGIFILFVAIALFMSFEPTATLIKEIVGGLLTIIFVAVVLVVVGGLIYLLFIRD